MFISRKKYREELNQAWINGHDVGVYEGKQRGRREQITATDIQNFLGRYLVSNRPHNDNILTRHACWVLRTKIYDHNPKTIYVWIECSECGHRENTQMFKTEDWNNYYKEHYHTINCPTFCECCGSMMDEQKEKQGEKQ